MKDLRKLMQLVCGLVCGLCLTSEVVAADKVALDEAQLPVSERFETNFSHTHDRGLYFRLGAGVAYAPQQILPELVGQETPSAWRLDEALALGLYLDDGFVAHVTQWGQLGATRGLLASGLGLSYYIDPKGMTLISASLGATTAYDQAPDIKAFEQWGLAGMVELGSGWWISREGGVGFVFGLGAHHMDLDGDGVRSTGWQAGLKLTWSVH